MTAGDCFCGPAIAILVDFGACGEMRAGTEAARALPVAAGPGVAGVASAVRTPGAVVARLFGAGTNDFGAGDIGIAVIVTLE